MGELLARRVRSLPPQGIYLQHFKLCDPISTFAAAALFMPEIDVIRSRRGAAGLKLSLMRPAWQVARWWRAMFFGRGPIAMTGLPPLSGFVAKPADTWMRQQASEF